MVEEPGFGVVLTEVGARGINVVQVVRSLTGLSAWRSRQLLDSAPVTVLEATWFERAAEAVTRLTVAGARAGLVCDWCTRVMSPEDCPVDPGPCSSRYWPATSCSASRPLP
ncbi:ribosomal protein L7/L12 [Streptomyces sp. NPDC001568]|uniref:ribosomal protein L7/L12 n=1 Tax=Streptomyces sp. NPDC001568 TaxID=3364588 RepID=UPI0036B5CE4A